jgi:hypothetical protein
MHIDELMMGMKVKVYDWHYDGEDRPGHWDEDGEMDEWLDCTVTIADFNMATGCVWIEEDEGHWEWVSDDFDPVCSLTADDPNLKFSQKKKDDFMEALKARRKEEQVRERINPLQYHGKTYSQGLNSYGTYNPMSPYGNSYGTYNPMSPYGKSGK